MQPLRRSMRSKRMWRAASAVVMRASLGIFLAGLPIGALACADHEAAAELGESSGRLRGNPAEDVEVNYPALQKADPTLDESEPPPSIQRPVSGAAAEIDEFFFAPIWFPGFGGVSVNCNLDDDPYGACL